MTEATGSPITVLVVDDCLLKRDGVVSALDGDPDIEVVGEADNRHAALELASRLHPDVVVVDPGMSSAEGPAALRGLVRSLGEARVVAVTAGERSGDVVDAVAAGVHGYLGRRSSRDDLRDAVKKVHAGAAVIDPTLAGRLMRQYARTARGEEPPTHEALTPRERDVLRLVATGHTQEEIAEELHIAARTVQLTLARLRQKTGLKRRRDLLRWAAEHQLV